MVPGAAGLAGVAAAVAAGEGGAATVGAGGTVLGGAGAAGEAAGACAKAWFELSAPTSVATTTNVLPIDICTTLLKEAASVAIIVPLRAPVSLPRGFARI